MNNTYEQGYIMGDAEFSFVPENGTVRIDDYS